MFGALFSVRSVPGASLRVPPWSPAVPKRSTTIRSICHSPPIRFRSKPSSARRADQLRRHGRGAVVLRRRHRARRRSLMACCRVSTRRMLQTRTGPVSLLDRLDFLSGVSGGSALAAYYGLRGRGGDGRFQAALPLVNAEEGLQTELSLGNIARGLNGGVNDAAQFPPWLDAHLYNHATFRDLLSRLAAARLDQCVGHLQSHRFHLRACHVLRAVQRSRQLSGVACGRGVGGGAGGVRADRHPELSGRLSGRLAAMGGARARRSRTPSR